MKPYFIILSILCYSVFALGQNAQVIENKATLFSIEEKKDTIDFIVVDTVLNQKKPVLLWCQGSLPIPLFCEIEGYGYYFIGGGISNFDLNKIVQHYHLVVISMPKTPVLAPKENLNQSFQYIPNPNKPKEFLMEYIEADYLDNYVNRADKVLKFLKKQTWVDKSQVIVAGHSQGTKIATKIARNNKKVSHLGLFAANPFGRIDQYIRQARLDAQLGKITWEEADSIMNAQYDFFEQVQTDESQAHHKAWKTFNETYYDDWLELDIPIYLAYGTEDRVADLCDLIPIFFMKKGKTNLTLKRYLGLEHNFFELSKNGRVNHEKAHWKEVMNTFIDWTK